MVDDSRSVEARLSMRCWGDFALRGEDEVDLRPRGRKPRALLAYLAMHPDMTIGRERLLGLLWGERGEEQARGSLRQAIQELKPLANGLGLLRVDRESLMLDGDRLVTDLDRLNQALQRRELDELIRGLPEPGDRIFADLEGLDSGFDDWLAIERSRQEDALVALIAEAHMAAVRSGDGRSARALETRLRERGAELVLAQVGEESSLLPPASPTAPVSLTPMVSARRTWLATATVAVLVLFVALSFAAFAPAGSVNGGGPETSSEVQSLYLSARERLKARNPTAIEDSRALLERAVAIDPNYAPAWSQLALVARLEGNRPGAEGERARVEALAHARRALALSPELAEAHGILGVILGFETAGGRRAIERAVSLDPNSPEIQYWMGNVHAAQGDHGRALAAFRRASDLDPSWTYPARQAAQMAISLGRRDEADTYLRRVEREGSVYDARLLRGLMELSAGDFSAAAVALGQARASTDDLGKQAMAAYNRAVVLFALGLTEEAQREWASCRLAWAQGRDSELNMPERYAGHLALRRGELPSAERIAEMNRRRGDERAQVFLREIVEGMVQAGRADEAVALYDGPDGLLGVSRRSWIAADLPVFAPTIASALVAVGRHDEARRILILADRQIASSLERSNGVIDAQDWGQAAATWAMLGRKDLALQAIERAAANGWMNADLQLEDLPEDIGTESVFESLRGDRRFESVRQRLNRRLASERAELLRILASA